MAPLAGLIGIKIKEFQLLAAPLAPAYGILVCSSTLVGNHWQILGYRLGGSVRAGQSYFKRLVNPTAAQAQMR